MLEKLLSVLGIHQAGMVLSIASNLVKAFETEYAKDHSAKLAAYDCLIGLIQQHRDSEANKAPVTPEVTPEA